MFTNVRFRAQTLTSPRSVDDVGSRTSTDASPGRKIVATVGVALVLVVLVFGIPVVFWPEGVDASGIGPWVYLGSMVAVAGLCMIAGQVLAVKAPLRAIGTGLLLGPLLSLVPLSLWFFHEILQFMGEA